MAGSDDSPIRLCVISHSCVIATNQAPWAAVAGDYPVELTLLAPRVWRGLRRGLTRLEVWPGLEGRVRPMTVLPRRHPNLHLWFGLGPALRDARPHVIFLDEEPYSLPAAQLLLSPWRRRPALLLYAKQNILKSYPPPLSRVERRILAVADGLVAVDPAARDVLQAKGARAPIAVIPHALDPQLYSPGAAHPTRARLGLTGPVVGYVGRLVPEKGVADLIEAVAALGHRPGLPDAARTPSLLIVGDGPALGDLRALAQARLPTPPGPPASSRACFTGAVPHDQVPAYYRCMDLLVLPSRTTRHWREQFGRTIVEALACGVPVVGSDSGAIPTTIGMTAGLVYPEGDISRLSEHLALLLTDPDRRRELAETGRRRVLESFTTEAVARALYGACREAWRRKTSSARHVDDAQNPGPPRPGGPPCR